MYGTPREGVSAVRRRRQLDRRRPRADARRWQRYEDGALGKTSTGADGPAYTRDRPTTQAAGCASASARRTPRAPPTRTRSRPRPGRGAPGAAVPRRRPPAAHGDADRDRRRSPARPAATRWRRLAESPLLAFRRPAFQTTGSSTITVRWGERRRSPGRSLRPRRAPGAGAAPEASRAACARWTPSRSTVGDVMTDGSGRIALRRPAPASRGRCTFGFRDTARRCGPQRVSVTRDPARDRRVSRPGGPIGAAWRAHPRACARSSSCRPCTAGAGDIRLDRLAATGGTFSYGARMRTARVRALVRTDPGWAFLTGALAGDLAA